MDGKISHIHYYTCAIRVLKTNLMFKLFSLCQLITSGLNTIIAMDSNHSWESLSVTVLYTHNHNDINNNSTYTYASTKANSVVQVRTHLLTSDFSSSTRG